MSGPLRLDASTIVPLPPGDTPLRVEGGEVEVYLTGSEGRRLVAVVTEGRHIFPLASPEEGRLLLAPKAPVLLRPDRGELLASARLWTHLHNGAEKLPDEPAALVPHLQHWTAQLGLRFSDEQAVRDRATLDRLRAVEGSGAEEGLAAELRWLLGAAGAEVELPPHRFRAVTFASLPGQLHPLGIRVREVRLPPDWITTDCGPLLLKDGQGRVAAALWSGGRYRRRGGRAVEPEAFDRRAWSLQTPVLALPRGVMGLVRFALDDIRREAPSYLLAGAALALLGLLLPILTGFLLDDFVPSGEAGLIAAAGVALFAAALFSAVLRGAQGLAQARITGRGAVRLAAALHDHVLKLPPSFFRTASAGDLNQRLQGMEAVRELVVRVLLASSLTALLAIGYFTLLFTYDLRLALIGLVLVLVYVGAVLLTRTLQMAPLRRAAVLDGEIAGLTFETIEAVAKLRSGAAEDRMLARWNALYRKERLTAARGETIANHFAAFSSGYEVIVPMTLFAAATLLSAGRLGAGEFIAFLTAFGLFQASLIGLSSELISLYAVQPLAERGDAIVAATPESPKGRADPGTLRGAIDVSELLFGYDPGGAPLIDGLSFRVDPGEHVAIVGGSGSGKSTLLRLLLGFEAPRAGSITYDGQDISHLDLGRLRGQIGVVLQSSLLYAGTILENIRGASGASLEQCLDAARLAGLEPDLSAMGMGIHTLITEGGGTFSGGQRQRILIARAIASNPRILFLDEATSALDNITQAHVSATLDALEVTRITIAHRLSTVQRADRIGVLKGGRFVELGSFAELMAKDGEFAALARRQLVED